MKRKILTFAAALAITAVPTLFAQSTLNTNAPGPSQETKPGQTNNNLQNPGSNMQQAPNQHGTYQEHGTVEGTTNESTTGTNSQTQTGTTPTPQDNTTTTTTTTTMTPPVDTKTTTTTPPETTTGTYNNSTTTTTDTTTAAPSTLPKTASDLPTVALAGLLALIAAFAVRFYAKRNA